MNPIPRRRDKLMTTAPTNGREPGIRDCTPFLVFRDGCLKPGDPLGLDRDYAEGTMDAYLATLGYQPERETSDVMCCLGYKLWEHRDGMGWLVEFGTCGHGCFIHCATWIDLIGLLRDLSIIALGGLIRAGDEGAILPYLAVKDEGKSPKKRD